MSFAQSLHDPLLYAVPAFAAFIALEVLSLRFLDDDARGELAGYEVRDTRTNMIMGVGSLIINGMCPRGRRCWATRRCTSSRRCAWMHTAGTPGSSP